jgi:hypothetical protein
METWKKKRRKTIKGQTFFGFVEMKRISIFVDDWGIQMVKVRRKRVIKQ